MLEINRYIRTHIMKKQLNRNAFHPRAVLMLAVAAVATSQHMAVAFSVNRMKTAKAPTLPGCLRLSRDEYLRPHFETSTSAVAELIYHFDFDRIVECAEDGECPVEEMTQMLKELQYFDEKEGRSSGVMLLEAENDGTRNAVVHPLSTQIDLATAKEEVMVEKQPSPSERDIHDLMRQMRDIADHEEV